jgi:nitrogen PTS system EIIA component
MQLSVRDATVLLRLPEKELYRLIKRNEIPHFRINKSCFFNKTELLEWAIARSIDISPEFFSSADIAVEQLPLLADALKNGGVHRFAGLRDKSEVLQKVVTLIPGINESESTLIYRALMARETLGSTAIGYGIAIPHVRNPIILNIKVPSVLLCFLDEPIDFGALDGEKVSTIFTMISPTARVHLHLLARLSFLLQNAKIRAILSHDNEPTRILATIRDAETAISDQPWQRRNTKR